MDKQIVAKKLRLLRGDRKREEVAIACGITAQAIAMYESGKRIPCLLYTSRLVCTPVLPVAA